MVNDMIQLRILRSRDSLELSGWTKYNLKSTYRKEARGSESEKDVKVEQQGGEMCFEGGGQDHKPSNAGCCWKLEKAKKQILP